MDWLLICPTCSDVVESFRSLRTLHTHFHCPLCQTDYDAALDDFIAVTFTVSPAVRGIRFHTPDLLSAWDYAFVRRWTPGGVLPDGVPWSEVCRSLTKVMGRVAPCSAVDFEIDAAAGAILGIDMDSDAEFLFAVKGEAVAATRRIPITLNAGKCVPDASDIAPGKVVLEIRNASERPAVFGAVQLPSAKLERPKLRFSPFLTVKRLLMTQTFRDLFRSEVIRAKEGIAVRDVTLLFTDLKGSTALYERIGDLNAYMKVQRHFEHIGDVTVRHQGAVIKTIGDAVMAAFLTPTDAVMAALEMRKAVEQLNSDQQRRDFVLKIGVHKGASIAVTLNERLDYFGQTVNVAARVQNLADADEVCMTEDVYAAAGMAEVLKSHHVKKNQEEPRRTKKNQEEPRRTNDEKNQEEPKKNQEEPRSPRHCVGLPRGRT